MAAIFGSAKSSKRAFSLVLHPVHLSVLLPAAALWLAALKAYVFTRLEALTEWPQTSVSQANSVGGRMYLFFGHPWKALLLGCMIGAVMTLWLNRYDWKHAEEIAERRVILNRSRKLLLPNERFWNRLGIVIAAFGVLGILCYGLRMSINVAIWGLVVAQFLSYKVNARIDGLMKTFYKAAHAPHPDSPASDGPSRVQIGRHVFFTAICIGSMIALTVYAFHSMPLMAEVELGLYEIRGFDLTSHQVNALEEQLTQNENNVKARAQLIGYYESQSEYSHSAHLQQHMLWFIEHRPEFFVGSPVEFLPKRDGGDTAPLLEAERLWQKQIESQPENTAILANAAEFFYGAENDSSRAAELMNRCLALEPNKRAWAERLDYFRALQNKQTTNGKELESDSSGLH